MESSLSPDDVITHILLGDRKEDPDILSDIFWDAPATVNWFSEHGYTLYTRLFMYGIYREWTVPSLPFEDILESNYPYAGHDITDFYDNPQPLRTSDLTGKLAYAQDSELHHVAIKAIFNDSEEYRILRYLHAQGLDTLQENCIMPVLDILPYRRNLCFVVMPR
ncbi:hypothetical protein HYPSUDRAFT_204015 [Hypholoma sublateritium FD-334 SS-4]|uniref:Uncharacterized protein n=1 Tax=Hypholoma sublateritium (strain FD-334 SS-4) TaxID=945553 RepID=A0A0D2NU93_HYPSF|nr:hypothetical protein HYPSUDRAFT_204015 [Hypholoma sublateritium FD-334 SS-4]